MYSATWWGEDRCTDGEARREVGEELGGGRKGVQTELKRPCGRKNGGGGQVYRMTSKVGLHT